MKSTAPESTKPMLIHAEFLTLQTPSRFTRCTIAHFLEYAWLHGLQDEDLLHRGDWSSRRPRDADLAPESEEGC